MHVPLWLQGILEVILGSDHVLGYTADTVRASADGMLLSRRHGASVTANGSSVIRAGIRSGLESRWRSKVKASEGA